MVLDFKSLSRKELQRLCKLHKLKANDKPVDMVAALEASRCSAVAVALAGGGGSSAEASRCSAMAVADGESAAEDDDEEFVDDEG